MRLAATTACSQSPDSKGSARHSPLSIPAVGAPGEAAVAARSGSDPGTGRSRWACGSPSPAAGPRASDPQASQLHRSEPARHSKTAAGHRARVGVLSRSPCRGNAQGEDPLQAWPTPASATPPRPPAPAMQRERRAAAAPSGSPSSSALAAATPSESAYADVRCRLRSCGAQGRPRGVRAAAGRAADCGARRRQRGVWAASAAGSGGRGAQGRRRQPRSARAALGRAGSSKACWRKLRESTQAVVVGRAGCRGACVRCRQGSARAAKQVARATVGNVG
jgi:hypothetical protein